MSTQGIAEAMRYFKTEVIKPRDRVFSAGPLPDTWYGALDNDGSVQVREKPVGPRSHRLDSLQAFCEAVSVFGGEYTNVFVGEADQNNAVITAILDNRDESKRTDRLHYHPHISHQFDTMRLMNAIPYDHAAFLRLLRIELHGCDLEHVERTFRALRFHKKQGKDSAVEIGKESMGLDIEQSLVTRNGEAESAIPEEVEARVHVYDDVLNEQGNVITHPVRLAIDVNLIDSTFHIRPFPGILEMTQQAITRWITEYITTHVSFFGDRDRIAVFAGRA